MLNQFNSIYSSSKNLTVRVDPREPGRPGGDGINRPESRFGRDARRKRSASRYFYAGFRFAEKVSPFPHLF